MHGLEPVQQLLQHRELLPLVETVADSLDSELKRLRAMQSLKSM